MIDQELVARITRLPTAQRLELIEALSRSLREELVVGEQTDTVSFAAVERLAQLLGMDIPHNSVVRRLFGSAATPNMPMTKEATRDAIADYLSEKHA